MRGVVLYRNKQLVPSAPASFDLLLEYAGLATKSGNVGLYVDWGCYFSCAQMQGLGGAWLDDQGQVQFDAGDYQAATEWFSQLQQIQETGALIEFNQDEALNLFKLGKIGMIIDGSWRAWSLADAVGGDNLAIDPWPVNGKTRMAGYVQADALFLNSNTVDFSPAEEQSALRFMGLLLTPEVQLRLAEVGFIPTVMATKPRDELKAELMDGLNSGIAFPPAWQGEVRQVYWASIDAAAQSVLERGVPARLALENAAAEIKERLLQIEIR
jgi:ABC-type glycerol-3-phosphate transport system substrate-binding protein